MASARRRSMTGWPPAPQESTCPPGTRRAASTRPSSTGARPAWARSSAAGSRPRPTRRPTSLRGRRSSELDHPDVAADPRGRRASGPPGSIGLGRRSSRTASPSPRRTRVEWVLADLAVMLRRRRDDHRSTRRRSPRTSPTSWPTPAAGVVFAENAAQVAKLREHARRAARRAAGHRLRRRPDAATTAGSSPLDELAELRRASASPATPAVVDARIDAARPRAPRRRSSTPPARPAGPRACGCTHDAWTYEGAAVDAHRHPHRGRPAVPLAAARRTSSARCCSTLPLQIGFPTAVDGRIDKIVDNLAVVKPTFMGAAPRIFEKALRPHHA